MNKVRPLHITIENPCNEAWGDMTPASNGRFCNHCQKTVIDFTTWSDAALYQFFSKQQTGVCGRFFTTQTERPIHIPHQPHSRLYRMTVALGLTLLFTQTPHLLAQSRPPFAEQRSTAEQQPTESAGRAGIKGKVVDDKMEPLLNATVQVFQNGILKGGAVTDYDGHYEVKPLEEGIYDVSVFYYGYDTFKVRAVQVNQNQIDVNAKLVRPPGVFEHVRTISVTAGVVRPLMHHPQMMMPQLQKQKIRRFDVIPGATSPERKNKLHPLTPPEGFWEKKMKKKRSH
ncbi:MAG: carboxypeptidase regulatory-like domain-containing protein [Bacteroidota bacterium]